MDLKKHVSLKATFIHEKASLKGKGQVEVPPKNGGTMAIESDAIIIATGSRSLNLPSLPVDRQRGKAQTMNKLAGEFK